jgi:hypothetical protein
MSILSIDIHSSKSWIILSFHFQNVTYESLDDIYCSKFSTGCNPHVLGWRQAEFRHHKRQPNWLSVHQIRLATVVVPHFDNRPLATRPVYMDDSGRLMTLLDLSPADFRWFLTVLVDRRILGSQCCLSTGLGTNDIRVTKRCKALS